MESFTILKDRLVCDIRQLFKKRFISFIRFMKRYLYVCCIDLKLIELLV